MENIDNNAYEDDRFNKLSQKLSMLLANKSNVKFSKLNNINNNQKENKAINNNKHDNMNNSYNIKSNKTYNSDNNSRKSSFNNNNNKRTTKSINKEINNDYYNTNLNNKNNNNNDNNNDNYNSINNTNTQKDSPNQYQEYSFNLKYNQQDEFDKLNSSNINNNNTNSIKTLGNCFNNENSPLRINTNQSYLNNNCNYLKDKDYIVNTFINESGEILELEHKLEKLEEKSFLMKKDNNLKANLLQEELNYLIKVIEDEKEHREEIKNKSEKEYKNVLASIEAIIESESNKIILDFTSIFANIEKNIDNINKESNFDIEELNVMIKDLKNNSSKFISSGLNDVCINVLQTEQALKESDISINNLNEYCINERQYIEDECNKLFNEVNKVVDTLNEEIHLENKAIETKENNLVEVVQSGLQEIKSNISNLNEIRIKTEEILLNKLETSCINMISNCTMSDEDY